MRPIINSEKHYVQNPLFSVPASALTEVNVVHAVQILAKDASFEVDQGSVIKAVYLEYWILNRGTLDDFIVTTVVKIPGAGLAMTFAESQNLNTYDNKKNILHTFEGIKPNSDQNPIPVIKQWLKIPRSKQRFGLNDKLVINFATGGSIVDVCGFSTYKEYK